MDEAIARPAPEGAAEQLATLDAIANVFSQQSGEKAIAAVHDLLFAGGVRRLTVATLNRDVASPVQYRYHADRAVAVTEPLDSQTLALALGAERLRELPPMQNIRVLDRGVAFAAPGRLPHAMVSPIRVAGSSIGFCVAQSDAPFPASAAALLHFASVLIGQDLEVGRENAQGAHAARALTLLLETARALPNPEARAIWLMGRAVSSINFLAKCRRRVCATAIGVAPR